MCLYKIFVFFLLLMVVVVVVDVLRQAFTLFQCWVKTHCVSQACLKLRVILLPWSLECFGITGVNHYAWFYTILGIEPRVSCVLSKHFTN